MKVESSDGVPARAPQGGCDAVMDEESQDAVEAMLCLSQSPSPFSVEWNPVVPHCLSKHSPLDQAPHEDESAAAHTGEMTPLAPRKSRSHMLRRPRCPRLMCPETDDGPASQQPPPAALADISNTATMRPPVRTLQQPAAGDGSASAKETRIQRYAREVRRASMGMRHPRLSNATVCSYS
jgi:hypothetical protein